MKLTDELDRRVPIKSTWINWKRIVNTVIILIMTPFLLIVGNWSLATVAEYQDLPERMLLAEKSIQELNPKLDKLIRMTEEHFKRDWTFVGKAIVVADGGRSGVWLNEFSKAVRYLDASRAKVTNLSYEGRRSCILDILGSIKNSNAEILLEVTGPAAIMLHADTVEIQVRIEPVNEN